MPVLVEYVPKKYYFSKTPWEDRFFDPKKSLFKIFPYHADFDWQVSGASAETKTIRKIPKKKCQMLILSSKSPKFPPTRVGQIMTYA